MTNTKPHTEEHLFDAADLADADPLMGAVQEQLDLELGETGVGPAAHGTAHTERGL